MDDSFRVRVEKIFGSLASTQGVKPPSSSSSSASASLSSLWCLTDDEIERNGWNRDTEGSGLDNMPRPGPFRSNGFLDQPIEEKKRVDVCQLMEKDLDELEDGDGGGEDANDEEEEERRSRASASRSNKPDDFNDEEWEIKSSIGLDCTLDFEDEEDAYDKVAVGKEEGGDHLYMKDVNDYETEADDWNELPDSFRDVDRDPRANLIAAKMRLKEDAETANKMGSLRVSEKLDSVHEIENKNSFEASENTHIRVDAQLDSSEDCSLKSILKRKDSEPDANRQKRVRFSSECKNDYGKAAEGISDHSMEMFSPGVGNGSDEEQKLQLDHPSGVPDYMRNPSRYTRYTFDSSEMDEESNKQAFMDFFKMLQDRRSSTKEEALIELPKSVPFIPKRKSDDATMAENVTDPEENQIKPSKELLHRRGIKISIAAMDETADAVCPMDEDEVEVGMGSRRGSAGSGRQYRTKAISEIDD